MPKKYPHKSKYRLKQYGLTEETYQALLQSQGYVCKICRKSESQKLYGKIIPLSVDHNHFTEEVRGLLCAKCNKLLGLADDNPTLLLRAIQYLKRKL